MLRARRFMHEHVQVAQWSGLPTTGGGGSLPGDNFDGDNFARGKFRHFS